MVLKKKNPAAPPAYTQQAGLGTQAEPSSSSSLPSVPPPAYIEPGFSSHGHSSSDIPLPAYDGPLFANYTPDRKAPPAAPPANAAASSTRGAANANVRDVEAQRAPAAYAPAPAARSFVQRQYAQARRPLAELNRQEKQQRALAYSFFTLLCIGSFWTLYAYLWASTPDRETSSEQQ